jgi:cytochrome c553
MNYFLNKTLLLILSTMFFAVASANAADLSAGKEKATACIACHGADGNSTSSDYPKLAGQHEDYLLQALSSYKTGKRKDPVMSAMATPLSEKDMKDLAAWFSSQKTGLAVKY